MKKKLIRSILYLLGAVALGLIVINTDWKEVLVHLSSISPNVIALLLLFQCITIILLALQWKSVALRVKKDVSFIDVLMVNAKGSVVDAITPGVKTGGELARVYELRKRLKIEFGNATIIVGLQKSLSLLAFLFLTLSSLIWFSFTISSKYRHYLYVFSIVIAIFSVLLALLILFSLKPDRMLRLLNRLLGRYEFMHKIDKILRDYSSIIRSLLKDKKRFFPQMLLAIFIWMFYAFKLMLVMKGFAIEMDYLSIAAITFLSYIMGMIPILPGSIGSFEGAMLALLATRGVSMEVGISIAFVFRFATFWFEFLLSCFILALNSAFGVLRKGDKNAEVRI